jgi:copper chaperone
MLAVAEEMVMLQFKVDGMTCENCVASVTRAVHRVAPSAMVLIDLSDGKVQVDGTTDRRIVASAITDAGFDVSPDSPS